MNTKWYASYTWAWLLAFLLQVAMVQAQTISGTVQASDGSPLIGASVIVKGTPRGVLTDGEGKFTLQASQGDILSISYIGYETQEVTVGTEDNISVSMVEADNTLSEVVVVGYGTQRREDLTGAIGSVNVDELADVPLVSVEQGIQGRVAGVNVTQGTGAPGGPMRVQIRGVGTTGDTEPLYVIDGYPVTVGSQGDLGTSPLTTLNPNDIESIDVLKDASAAAIYGARAANGVVIITTKRGKAGAVKVDFSAKAGVQTPWRRLDLLGEKDYVEYVVEKYANDPNTTVDDIPANLRDPNNLPGNNTDWQDELFRTAPMQDYNASITGGNENASFNLGLGYFDQQGTMLGTYFKRLSIKLNSDYKINKRIRVGESVLVSQTEKRVEGNLGGRRQLEHLVKQAASVPVFDESFQGGYGAPVTDDGQDARNPVMVADLYENIPRQYRVLGTLYGEVDILDGLTYRINLGVDVFIGRGYNYNPVYEGTRRLLIQSNFSENYGLTVNPLIEHTLNFNRSFGDHNLGLLIGVTDQSFNNRSISGSVIDLPNNTVRSLSAGQNPTLSGFLFESRLRSQLARLTYGYADKYLLTANVRRDGSSRLNPDNRYDIFPSASLGWRVSKESFMESVSFVSDLKLRASYGIIGNDKTAPIYNTLNLDNVFNYNFNGVLANGVTQGSLINPDLRWEISEQTNFGADIGLW
ncbi:MAG: SusC/RagA family TonB-linked outer membrane protein, partial [Bacteroidota bacterium]